MSTRAARYLDAYRIAALLLLVMSIGHTTGEMLAVKSYGPQADAVFASMKSVHFDFFGTSRSYYDFWFSLGLVTSLFLLLSAVVAWQLARASEPQWAVLAPIAWALFGSHVCNAILSWTYSHKGAGLITSTIAVLLGVGALQKARRARRVRG